MGEQKTIHDPEETCAGRVAYQCPRCGGSGPNDVYVYTGAWFRAEDFQLAEDIERDPPRPEATTLCLKKTDAGGECGNRDSLSSFTVGRLRPATAMR